jgi:hypothetical protein
MPIKSLLLTLSLLLSFNAVADNESLDIEFSEAIPRLISKCFSKTTVGQCYFFTYQSCNTLLGVMHEAWTSRDNYDALFPNGKLPECINNELPEAWIESRTPINKYGETICKIPCNIRSLPILSNSITDIGRINGSQEILILEVIEVNDNVNNYHLSTPWYNHWYSFIHEGKKLYIHTENVSLKD